MGDEDAILDPFGEQVDAMFQTIVEGVAANERPAEVSDSIADSVDRLFLALRKAAPRIEVAVPGHGSQMLETRLIDRRPWQRHGGEEAGEVSVHGVLEMVDLHSARFRLRDAAGNAIDLLEVAEPGEAARLVGTPVTAAGVFAIGRGTQHHRMEGAHIAPQQSLENRLGIQPPPSIEHLRQRALGTPTPRPVDISDEELDDFLAEIRA